MDKEENKNNESPDICPDCGKTHKDLYEYVDSLASKFTKEEFPELWKRAKKDKEISKRELAENIFYAAAAGMLDYFLELTGRDYFDKVEKEIRKELEKEKEKLGEKEFLKKLDEGNIEDSNGFWEAGGFVQSVGSDELTDEKMKTFHMSHDEDVNYDCKKCGKKISAHNRDWHDGMCDKCFNKEVYGKDFGGD